MPRTLLLADDSITIQKVVAITFAAEDFTVVAVDNGEDAYARARELHPAIVLADVSMPRRNGYELAHALKSDPQLRQIPVLLLAGTFEPLDPAKAQASLADGHLVKPFDSQVLIDRVNELLGTAPAAQAPVPLAAPAPAARPAAPPQAWPAQAPAQQPRPPGPPGLPQRPVPLTQQAGARPSTSPFGIPAAPQPPAQAPVPQAPMPPQPMRPAAAAPSIPAPAPRPMPLTSPFPSAPSAVPARPQPAGMAPSPLPSPPPGERGFAAPSPFAPPQAFPGAAPAASPFPSAAAPRPPAPAPAAPTPFPPKAPVAPSAPRPTAPFGAPAASAPAPSPTTNLWGTPQARPTAPIPVPVAPSPVPYSPPPAAVAPVPLPAPTPRPAAPQRPGSMTPTWGAPAVPPAPAPQFAQPVSPDVSGMAEAAAAASVQPSAADMSLDVSMEEEPPELLPETEGFELGGSQDFDIGMTGGSSAFVSGALSDFSQQGGSLPVEGLDFDDSGSSSQPVELASPHEFLDDHTQPDIFASEPFSAPTPAAALPPVPSPPPFEPAPVAKVAAPSATDGEAALRLALSQASREVIERVVWEVVPQLAEIILREHIERMEQQRSGQ